MATYGWLKDQSKHDEVVKWLGGRWDIEGPQGLAAWCKGRFGLDELKEWIDGKFTIDQVVQWNYHESDFICNMVRTLSSIYDPWMQDRNGFIRFIGINRDLGMGGMRDVYVAFQGDQELFDCFREDAINFIPPVNGVTNFTPERVIETPDTSKSLAWQGYRWDMELLKINPSGTRNFDLGQLSRLMASIPQYRDPSNPIRNITINLPSEETIEWLGGRWDIDQLQAWANGRFTLDELKEWIDGTYTIDEVVAWRYHESDPIAKMAALAVEAYRPGIEKDKGVLAFLGIDANGDAHIALDGACGSCTFRETGTLQDMSEFIATQIPEIRTLINDGPRRTSLGNFGVEDFSAIQGTPVQISSLSRNLAPPTSNT